MSVKTHPPSRSAQLPGIGAWQMHLKIRLQVQQEKEPLPLNKAESEDQWVNQGGDPRVFLVGL